MFNRTYMLLLFCLTSGSTTAQTGDIVPLPEPSVTGAASIEQLLAQRRSERDFLVSALQLAEIGQLLWAAQGITHTRGMRTAPSAGALYPLELYVVSGRIEGLEQGVYRYDPGDHQLERISDGDRLDEISRAAYSQGWIKDASTIIVFTADYNRTTVKYGDRGKPYVHIEVGHAAQNLFLQAGSLGLSAVVVGAFNERQMAELLRLPAELKPLLLMPVGRRK